MLTINAFNESQYSGNSQIYRTAIKCITRFSFPFFFSYINNVLYIFSKLLCESKPDGKNIQII